MVRVNVKAAAHIECELQDYHQTRRDIIRMENELDSEQPMPNISRRSRSRKSSLLASHLRLSEMVRVVSAIDAVMERVPVEKQELIKLRYWCGSPSWQTIAEHLRCGPKIVKRWHTEVVHEIAEELGWLSFLN